MNITKLGPYRTRSGDVIFVTRVHSHDDCKYPVEGYLMSRGHEFLSFTRNGSEYRNRGESGRDIVSFIEEFPTDPKKEKLLVITKLGKYKTRDGQTHIVTDLTRSGHSYPSVYNIQAKNDHGEIFTYTSGGRFYVDNDKKNALDLVEFIEETPPDNLEPPIQEEFDLMVKYAQLMLDRRDFHGLWDAAIDLQRIKDRIERTKL